MTRLQLSITKIFLITAIIVLISSVAGNKVIAQSNADEAVYIVQPGDTINIIAIRFGISASELITANNLENPDYLQVNSQLVIPGMVGISGVLTTQTTSLGSNFGSMTRQYGLSPKTLGKLNRLTSPSEVYVGSSIIVPTIDGEAVTRPLLHLTKLENLLENSALIGSNPWAAAVASNSNNTWSFIPGEPIAIPLNFQSTTGTNIPHINAINIYPLPLVQGRTATISIETDQPALITGRLDGQPLHFFSSGNNGYIAIQGIHAFADIGLTDFSIVAEFAEDNVSHFDQSILLDYGYYIQDPPLYVKPETIDPAITKPEDELVKSITTPATPDKYWDDIFKQPVDDPACIFSTFGNRRSYNGSDYTYFHTGVDYGYCGGINIYSPAKGIVVYTGELTVRGFSTIIDHGWGIYSGFWHQNKILVNVGDFIEVGELIGEIGGTGRVTGPHLHWELWVNGVQVNPLDWLENPYP